MRTRHIVRILFALLITSTLSACVTTGDVDRKIANATQVSRQYTDQAVAHGQNQTRQYVDQSVSTASQQNKQYTDQAVNGLGTRVTATETRFGQHEQRVEGRFKATDDGLAEVRSAQARTQGQVDGQSKVIKKLKEEEAPPATAAATAQPDISTWVAGEGTPRSKEVLATSECIEIEGVGVNCRNPSVRHLTQMKKEGRSITGITALGPTQEAIDAAWASFIRSAEKAGWDITTITPPSDANKAKRIGQGSVTVINVDFDDIPATVKAVRKAPKLATP